MKRLFPMLALLALSAAGFPKEPPRQLDKANVLPLALDDAFQFRKTKTFLNDPQFFKPSAEDMVSFERQRINFGAITQLDRQQRYGHYYTIWWRANRKADVTVRFEFRQQRLGSYVQAKEINYTSAKGTMQSQFQVTGDDYIEEGKVTAWRAVVIENGKIVALTQSFLWN